jgi:hypothetical protein
MSVVPSIIVLMITALVVFRRELTGRPAGPALTPPPVAPRPAGRSSRPSNNPRHESRSVRPPLLNPSAAKPTKTSMRVVQTRAYPD